MVEGVVLATSKVLDGQGGRTMEFRYGAACFDSYERIMILCEE